MNTPYPVPSAARKIGARLVLCATLALTACAQVPSGPATKVRAETLVYPKPPDEPRFAFERGIYSSADVVPDSKDASFRRLVTGETRGGYFLGKPYAVAVHKGRVFVTDTAERQVKAFDLPEGKYFSIGDAEPGQLSKPLGIDTDHAGNLYVADASAKAVLVYDRDGRYLRKIGGEKLFDRMSSVTVDPQGERLYVVDIGGVNSENHRVRVFNPKTGAHIMDNGRRGTGAGEFNLPRDLAIGKEGRLYVVDGGNFRVQVFNADGSFRESFGTVGRQLGNFARPKEVATDPGGNVYVVDAAFGNFQIFNADGDLLMFVGERSERDGPGKYMLPSGIAVDDDGRVFFVDQWFRKVEIFRPYTLAEGQGNLTRAAAAPAR